MSRVGWIEIPMWLSKVTRAAHAYALEAAMDAAQRMGADAVDERYEVRRNEDGVVIFRFKVLRHRPDALGGQTA